MVEAQVHEWESVFGSVVTSGSKYCQAIINFLARKTDKIRKQVIKDAGPRKSVPTPKVPIKRERASSITLSDVTSTVEHVTTASSTHMVAVLSDRLEKFQTSVSDRLSAMEKSMIQLETRIQANHECTFYSPSPIF